MAGKFDNINLSIIIWLYFHKIPATSFWGYSQSCIHENHHNSINPLIRQHAAFFGKYARDE